MRIGVVEEMGGHWQLWLNLTNLALLREGLNEKKTFSFGHCLNDGGGGAEWAKSGGEAVLLQFSDFTKDPMHDFNRLFC